MGTAGTGINLEEVKKYNEALKSYTEKSSKIQAELEINSNELNRLCVELTQELGIQVTVDNIEQIYTEHINKIQETLNLGNEVLTRIANEEADLANRNSSPQVGVVGGAGQPPVMGEVIQQAPPVPEGSPLMGEGQLLGVPTQVDVGTPQTVGQAPQVPEGPTLIQGTNFDSFIPNTEAFGSSPDTELPPMDPNQIKL